MVRGKKVMKQYALAPYDMIWLAKTTSLWQLAPIFQTCDNIRSVE